MVLPLLAGALVSAGSIGMGVYNVGRAIEEKRYWDHYARSIGRPIRYPFRSGYYDYFKYASAGLRNVGFAGFKWWN